MVNTFEVQKLPSNFIKVGEKIILTLCADVRVQAVFEAVGNESFKDTGDAIRRV